jgi:hypothetical protein
MIVIGQCAYKDCTLVQSIFVKSMVDIINAVMLTVLPLLNLDACASDMVLKSLFASSTAAKTEWSHAAFAKNMVLPKFAQCWNAISLYSGKVLFLMLEIRPDNKRAQLSQNKT